MIKIIYALYSMKLCLLLFLFNYSNEMVISLYNNNEAIFINEQVNKHFQSTFFLPSCSMYHSSLFGNNDHSSINNELILLIDIKYNEQLPTFTYEINDNTQRSSSSYFTITQTNPLQYKMTIHNLCTNNTAYQSDKETIVASQRVITSNTIEQSNESHKKLKFTFTYNNQNTPSFSPTYTFYIVHTCTCRSTFHIIFAFIIQLIVYSIILFLTTSFQIDFQVINFIHTYTRLKWWFGPSLTVFLSISIILVHKYPLCYSIANFILVSLCGLACTQTLNWLMNEIATLQIQNTFLSKVQTVLMYEIICHISILNLICSVSFKLVFILWLTTQSVVLGNLMVFCLIFVCVSSVRVTKMKNCFYLLMWIFVYDILWKYLGNKYFTVNLNLFYSQTLNAPTAISLKQNGCWKYIYISELVFPGIAIKFCKVFDSYVADKQKRSYYKYAYVIVIAAMIVCFVFHIEFYYLVIVLVGLMGGLISKSVKDGMVVMLWKGVNKYGEAKEGSGDSDGSDNEGEGTTLENEVIVSRTELKHFL